jgi:class 3 adenylate cyclase
MFFNLVVHGQPVEKAYHLYRELLAQKEDTAGILEFNNFLSRLADTYPDTCLKYGERLYNLSEQAGYAKGKALALNIQGVALERKDYGEAIRKYEQCVAISLQHNLQTVLNSAYNNLSIVYSYMGLYELSLEYLIKSLKIAEEINDSSRMAVALNNIGLRYYELSNIGEALVYFQNALKINENMRRFDRIAINYNNLGNAYYQKQQYDTAITFYQKAIILNTQLKSSYNLLINYQAMVYPLVKLRNMKHAREYSAKSMALADELNDMYGKANGHLLEALIYNAEGDPGRAILSAGKAYDLAATIGARMLILDVYESLAESYKSKKDYQKALEFTGKYNSLRDSVQNQEKDNALSKVTTYEREKQEQEIKLLEKESEIQKLKIKRQKILRNSLILAGVLLMAIAALLWNRYTYVRRTKDQLAGKNKIIEKEKERSDELLLNILPAETARELKEKGSSDARHYEMVTVLFTDFKGFTQLSEQLSPTELVAEIDHCYKEFDRIITRHGVEKIKTIGDAYMCAGGLPVPNTTNPLDVLKAAIDIQLFMQDLKKQRMTEGRPCFELRIGVHTGPVVAGIVGIKKFAYDIWGDTVNIASRMESSGDVGKINISQTTYEKVKDLAVCMHRGKIAAKGKGEIDMYFVEALSGVGDVG